jgi:tryptophanyl-tRNA synthetase
LLPELIPEIATLYVQSDVPEVAELYLLLNMNAYMGELERCTTFKDKARKQTDNINAGLLTYPVLMAADILIHRATKVPVGKDQEQHLEMARTFGKRFNRMYNNEYFPEPYAFNFGVELIKIPGLDGSTKMGKSEGEGQCCVPGRRSCCNPQKGYESSFRQRAYTDEPTQSTIHRKPV